MEEGKGEYDGGRKKGTGMEEGKVKRMEGEKGTWMESEGRKRKEAGGGVWKRGEGKAIKRLKNESVWKRGGRTDVKEKSIKGGGGIQRIYQMRI
jgi:hypothetical protein